MQHCKALTTTDETFHSSLIKLKSWGGLTKVTDEVLNIFTCVECIFREAIDSNCITNIPTSTLTKKCLKDKIVKLYMKCVQDTSASETTKEAFLERIILTYIHSRCNGFCRQMMQRYRLTKQITKQSKSLRKNLAQS